MSKDRSEVVTAEAVEQGPVYTMSVDLSVLESLGINLYSNAAAVLSELVANAYDADSTVVSIAWKEDQKTVVVVDDGIGMAVDELNDRFLTVGYKKRDVEGAISDKFKRPFMGRKGIGKLSVFSIAQTVTLYSTKDGASHGLRIKVEDLEACIKKREDYHPESIEVPAEHAKQGTTLVLSRLKSKRAGLTVNALRKRLARRFDVLDETPPEDGGFRIEVNSKRITWADRQELKTLEFIWEFGKESLPASALPKGITRFVLLEDTAGRADWQVRGWIGTARQPTDLTKDKEAGSLKNVIVLARKRPIQEGIIEKLDFSRIFGNYVTGQIEADFLDLDEGYEDIATSDRQRLIEDDERVLALQKLLRSSFVKAAEQWSNERPKKEAKDVLDKFPQLKKWVDDRPAGQHGPAQKMIGTIAALTLEKENEGQDRADLLRAGVLAFERVGLRKTSEDLDQLSGVTAENLLPLLGQQDAYEEALWGDIVRSRLEAIERFQGLTEANEKERVLQEHLFKNLWLLDPAWERATGSEQMEQALHKIAPGLFPEIALELHDHMPSAQGCVADVQATCDLASVRFHKTQLQADVLADQGVKYYEALENILKKQQISDRDIEVIFVLGDPPGAAKKGKQSEAEYFESQFANSNGRFVLYDRLIANANNQYEEYLGASKRANTLNDLLTTLDPNLLASDGADEKEPSAG